MKKGHITQEEFDLLVNLPRPDDESAALASSSRTSSAVSSPRPQLAVESPAPDDPTLEEDIPPTTVHPHQLWLSANIVADVDLTVLYRFFDDGEYVGCKTAFGLELWFYSVWFLLFQLLLGLYCMF